MQKKSISKENKKTQINIKKGFCCIACIRPSPTLYFVPAYLSRAHHLLPRSLLLSSHSARGIPPNTSRAPLPAAARAPAPPTPPLPTLLAAAMRFDLDGLPVHFPYAAIYPEQHAYMGE